MKLKELVNTIETDVSGKWVSISEVEKLAILVVDHCAKYVESNLDDDKAITVALNMKKDFYQHIQGNYHE